MKAQRIYIDTSVLGGCFDDEFAKWSNGLIKDFRLGNLAPVISDILEAEATDAPAHVRGVLADLVASGAERVVADDDVVALADLYLSRGVLTPKYYDDGLHVGLATVSGVDAIVSWNFRHIVHLDKIKAFNAINAEQGYGLLHILSPREVTNYEVETYEEASGQSS
jgi:hypothetical protein